MNLKNVNWLAIIAAVIASMAIGFLWYGYLFMDQWMVLNSITLDGTGDKMFKDGVEIVQSPTPMIINTIAVVIYALFMRWLLEKSNSLTLSGGFKMGLAIGLILYMGTAVNNMFAQTDYSLTQIDGSYALVLWTVIGTIIGAWQKKSTS